MWEDKEAVMTDEVPDMWKQVGLLLQLKRMSTDLWQVEKISYKGSEWAKTHCSYIDLTFPIYVVLTFASESCCEALWDTNESLKRVQLNPV